MQYGISALVSQTSFHGKPASGGVAKWRLFSSAKNYTVPCKSCVIIDCCFSLKGYNNIYNAFSVEWTFGDSCTRWHRGKPRGIKLPRSILRKIINSLTWLSVCKCSSLMSRGKCITVPVELRRCSCSGGQKKLEQLGKLFQVIITNGCLLLKTD